MLNRVKKLQHQWMEKDRVIGPSTLSRKLLSHQAPLLRIPVQWLYLCNFLQTTVDRIYSEREISPGMVNAWHRAAIKMRVMLTRNPITAS
jgi:hypothetical protein